MEHKDKTKLKEKFEVNPLKPCPFCGKEIQIYSRECGDGYPSQVETWYEVWHEDPNPCTVGLQTRGIHGITNEELVILRQEMIELWNRRIK